ncbi:MAG: sigma-70 family RNA polymerase sigma factor [Planctomycetota bacterium]
MALLHRDDYDLVQRALALDPDATRRFAQRVACVAPFVRRFCRRGGTPVSEAVVEDIAQETYLALWRKAEGYRGTTRLESWACGFAAVEVQRWRRRRARSLQREQSEGAVAGAVPGEVPSDTRDYLERAIERLGPPASTVIRLKHFEELTFDAIADRLSLSPNTAKSHYYRGLERLRTVIGPGREDLAS